MPTFNLKTVIYRRDRIPDLKSGLKSLRFENQADLSIDKVII